MRQIKFRAWDKENKKMIVPDELAAFQPFMSWFGDVFTNGYKRDFEMLQFTGLHDKNGKEIYEGDIVGKEGVYHFIERKGWAPNTGKWKIIGEKTKSFIGGKEERYIAGYELSVVSWQSESCGFEPFSDSIENCGHCGGGKRAGDIEVIGNIYENPELLETN